MMGMFGSLGRLFANAKQAPTSPDGMPVQHVSFGDKLGLLGDTLAGNNATGSRLAQARAEQLGEFQYQRQRADRQSDFMTEQQWALDHPKPVNNDTVNDFNFITQQLGPEAGRQYLQTFAAGPPMAVDSIDPATGNTVRSYQPRAALPGMGQGAPAPMQRPTIGAVMTDPRKAGAGSGQHTFPRLGF